MKKSIAFLFIILLPCLLYSNDSLRMRLGVYAGYNLNSHSSDFKKIPDCPNCSPGFKDGSGSGPTFGVLFDYPLIKSLFTGIRIGYSDISGDLTSTEATDILVEGIKQKGSFEHKIKSNLSVLSFTPNVRLSIFENLSFSLGFQLGLLIKKEYSQYEKIVSPSDYGTFLDENGNDTESRYRNELSGEINEANSLLISPHFSLSYYLPLDNNENFQLQPELNYSFAFSDIINHSTVNKWKVNSLSIGLAIIYSPSLPPEIIEIEKQKYIIDTVSLVNDQIKKQVLITGKIYENIIKEEVEDSLITTTIINRTDTLLIPKAYKLEADVTASYMDKNVSKNLDKIVFEEFVLNKLQPLLNYVFFDLNDSRINNKYYLLSKEQANQFTESSTYSMNTLETYHHIINIIGYRMKQFENSTITLTASTDGSDTEKSNQDLTKARAASIKDYLVNIWDIKENRIKVVLKTLPDKASKPLNDPEKMEENRRVEITSNLYDITKPIFAADTLRTSKPEFISFNYTYEAEAGIDSFSIITTQNGKIAKQFSINDLNQKTVNWNLKEENRLPIFGKNLEYFVKAVDKKGNIKISSPKKLNIDQITIGEKRKSKAGDKEIDNFSLILFDFDKSDIKGDNKKIIDMIKNRIKPNSTIEIIGYTDQTGEASYNTTLSYKRAVQAKNLINRDDAAAVGKGEEVLIYDNSTPEGRFYCRTVNIIVETPVE